MKILILAAAGFAIGALLGWQLYSAPDPVRLHSDRGIRELELYLSRQAAA
jgi:hypothetical protein